MQLAHAAGRGDTSAFDALYQRHHLPLLAFARHMLGRRHDAEDVVQHTFLAADRAFRAGKVPERRPRLALHGRAQPLRLGPARASRRSRARRGRESAAPRTGLAAEVEQREELRALAADVRRLPDDQRAALGLAELGELSHVEVARVIGVRQGKVKALVFQAREALAAASPWVLAAVLCEPRGAERGHPRGSPSVAPAPTTWSSCDEPPQALGAGPAAAEGAGDPAAGRPERGSALRERRRGGGREREREAPGQRRGALRRRLPRRQSRATIAAVWAVPSGAAVRSASPG